MYRWIAWNILFRIQEWAKGHPTYTILREMEAADRLSVSGLEQLRNEKLQKFIDYCYRHVPYVRTMMQEAGVAPSQIHQPGDLIRLPVMSKADVRKHRAALRSESATKLTSFSTGGSTGEPLQFDVSRRRTASQVACRQRVGRWWGVSVGVPEFVLWGSPVELTRQDRVRNWRDRLLSTELLSAFEMNEAIMSQYLDRIIQRGCQQFFGYPSSIYRLCLHARRQGLDLRRLGIKVVFVTGEVLYPYQRQFIMESMNCPVADGYGGRDSGFVAHECPTGGMHVMADAVIVEILDPKGQPVPPGEAGEIVVTDLYSEEAPFLRYRTGDIAALSSRQCTCGRPLPLLENIEGRSADEVVAPDGRRLHALSMIYVIREVEGVEQFRIIQQELDRFHVQLVCGESYPRNGEFRIRDGLARRLRWPVHVTFEYLSDFSQERSGKFRHVVSAVALPGEAASAPILSQTQSGT